MSALVIIPRSNVDDATIDCSPSPEAGMGADNLQNNERGSILRVLGDEAHLTVDFVGSRRIGGIVLRRHNLDGAASWRARVYSAAALGGSLLVDTGIQPALKAKTLAELDWGIEPFGTVVGNADYSYFLFPNVVGGSMLIDIDAPGLANIDIGRLIAGRQLTLTYNYDFGSKLKWDRVTRRKRMASGALRSESGERFRRLTIDLSWILDSERSQIADLLSQTGTSKELWISARTGATGTLETDNALAGWLTEDPDLIRPNAGRYTTNLQIEES